jgi:hypothetical protein
MAVCLLAGQHLLILELRAHDAGHERGTLLETADPTRESAPAEARRRRTGVRDPLLLSCYASQPRDVEVVVLASDQIAE